MYLWLNTWSIAPIISLIWTLFHAYHHFWAYPLKEGMQIRTYDRLRNRLGQDWDLAATTEEFELERKKSELEQKLKLLLPSSLRAIVAPIIISIAWNFLRAGLAPILFSLTVISANLLFFLGMHFWLKWRIQENQARVDALKKAEKQVIAQNRLVISQVPKHGMRYTVGEDGELLEIPVSQDSAKTD